LGHEKKKKEERTGIRGMYTAALRTETYLFGKEEVAPQ
jgi:hypothetical protein